MSKSNWWFAGCSLVLLSLPVVAATGPAEKPAAAALTGMWRGEYQYAKESGKEPVKFDMILIQDGEKVAGFINEPNTFGKRQNQPKLHAVLEGRFEQKSGKLTFTKTYDGTAGETQAVEFSGTIAKDGKKGEGKWSLGNDAAGAFTVEKAAKSSAGPLAGLWSGTFEYPEGSGQEPVKFTLALVYEGEEVRGFIKEPNTFGDKEEPWLHAEVKGSLEKETRKLIFTKTYDGTAGQSHDVEYSGELSRDGKNLEGTWTLGGNLSGKFTLEKKALPR